MKHNFWELIKNIFLPASCIGCGKMGSAFCRDCLALISLNRTPALFPAPSHISALFFASSYENPLLQKAVKILKYPPFSKEIAKHLAFLIIAHLALVDKPFQFTIGNSFKTKEWDYLFCPIPLHKKRLKWRGFNHAEEIAKHLAFASNIPMATDILLKVRHTKPQVDLDGEERKRNVRNCFATAHQEKIQGKTIFLVDDVCTTGATLEEAARTLKQAGAHRVYGLVVARG
ncbi:MAG: ComF family protein [Candidatus Wildermuthbacteria bacterium]|nr:ComF family protein [Candidatus Wildermuthbacteria bacterium]